MNIGNHKHNVSFKESIVEFNQLKTNAFSGNVIIQVVGTPGWMLSFSSGRLSGVSGGIDAIGRWTRSLALASLNAPLDCLIKSTNREEIFLNSNKLAQAWAVKEILFDIIQFSQHQGDKLTYQVIPAPGKLKLTSSLPLLDLQPLLHAAIQSWQEWARNGLDRFPPSLIPVIQQPDRVAEFEDINDLQYLISSIDGTRSLRSLAIHHHKQSIDVAMNLLPLFKSGVITLVAPPTSHIDIDIRDRTVVAPFGGFDDRDLAETIEIITDLPLENYPQDLPETPPLIACIDDSLFVCKSLEKILTSEGYRCLSIQDPLKIISTLIKAKPDLIFLDLVMPINNGYEVCEQIRKTPCLANIPIIILTGSDGFIDRVRSKFVGANGFLSKPAQPEQVIKAIDKYLNKSRLIQFGTERHPHRLELTTQSHQLEIAKDVAKRVLIVDDDDNIREVVSMCLRKLKGWNIVTAASGQEGLNTVRTHTPDAILLDVMMPNMDGLAFLRSLRADPAHQTIPVVLLTANLYLPGRQLLTELGVADIISKPFVPIELAQQLDRVI